MDRTESNGSLGPEVPEKARRSGKLRIVPLVVKYAQPALVVSLRAGYTPRGPE